jgi:hypothetical protein
MLSKLFLLSLTLWLGMHKPAPHMDGAKGTLAYKGKTKNASVVLTSAYLITGPDFMDKSVRFRRLVFSTKDISSQIKACATLGCVDSAFEGLQLDLVEGPRYNYWMVLDGQKIQYSGTCAPGALTLTTNKADHLVGTFTLDASGAGGPNIKVAFDTKLAKSFAK